MHLYYFQEFDDSTKDVIVSAGSHVEAVRIYEESTGHSFSGPKTGQLFGNIELALSERPSELTVWLRVKDGCIHAIDDADNWARVWPSQVIKFVQMWGEQ